MVFDFVETYDTLRGHIQEMLAVVVPAIAGRAFNNADHFEFMAQLFLCRQVDHAKGALKLEMHRDIRLIARTMHEGMCQLVWSAHDPQERAERWRAFSIIHDWRLDREESIRDGFVRQPRAREIQNQLKRWHDVFLDGRARKKLREGKPLPADPYVKNWTGKNLKQLIEEIPVSRDEEYDLLYVNLSEWPHWDAAGLGKAIERDEHGALYYQDGSPRTSVSSLTIVFRSLYETARLVDSRLSLGIAGRLAEVRDKFVTAMQPHQAQRRSFGV
jgi:hypothetical protein